MIHYLFYMVIFQLIYIVTSQSTLAEPLYADTAYCAITNRHSSTKDNSDKEKESEYVQNFWGGLHFYFSGKTQNNKIIKPYQHIIIAAYNITQKEKLTPHLNLGFGFNVVQLREGYGVSQFPVIIGIASQYGSNYGAYLGIYYQAYPYVNARKPKNSLVYGNSDYKYSLGFGYKSYLLRTGVILGNLGITVQYAYHNTKDYKTKFISFGLEGKNFLMNWWDKDE